MGLLETHSESSTGSRGNAPGDRLPLGPTDPAPVTQPEGQTDLANARRLVKLHGDKIRFCHAWRKWLVWDGARWKIDDSGAVERLGKSVADYIWNEARDSSNNAALKHASNSAGARRIEAMVSLAQSEFPVPVTPAELDANPWLLNCENGTVDLRTGTLREHRREDCLTQVCPVQFEAASSCEAWERFLEEIFGGDDELVGFVQRLFGYVLSGDVREQVLPIFWGCGANGKSTLLNAFLGVLGPDYSMQAIPDLLMQKKSDSHPTERADLFGKRFVSAVETEHNRRLAESMVKQLTGGERIRARRMREDFWEFEPTHKLVLCTNHKPQVKGRDHAIWRRLRLVPFNVRFESDRQDKKLPEKLDAEAAGILAWTVRGCLDWQERGLGEPAAVSVATDDYRSEQDIIGRFIDERCLTGESYRIRFKDFYESLEAWCGENGDDLPAKKVVGLSLKERGFKEKTSNGRWYLGLGLTVETVDDGGF